ncbi:hypothetical protein BJX76DRAFT_365650 [Aspergillus varians]
MTAITGEHVAIAELVIYIPIALVTIFVVFRHGFHKQLGWIYLLIFCVVRVAGAILQILSHKNPDDSKEKEWAAILSSVGLSPLILASLGFLKRVFDETTSRTPNPKTSQRIQMLSASSGIIGRLLGLYSKRATAVSRRSRAVQLLHIPALISLILAISGGTDQASSNPSDQHSGKHESRAAIILFVLVYVALALLWVITARDLPVLVTSQRRIYFAVFLALPFMAVRLLYSLIGGFGHDRRFSVVDGDTAVQLGMATIEEFVVVLVYTILGVVTPRSDAGSPVPGARV